ncbi:hypothetical protein BH10PSE18_BH10PSE18_14970 [soil metagenome]
MAETTDKYRAALEAARNGLQWYRDAYPEADSGADDEMMALIEEALASKAAPQEDQMLKDLKHALKDATELRQQITLMEEHMRGETWRWQADKSDDLATMGNRMGVLIYASDLRDLLASKAAAPAIVLDFKMASELLEMFGGEPGTITLMHGDGHSGKGLYAHYEEYPEEGAEFLGVPNDEAAPPPAAVAAEPLTQQSYEDAKVGYAEDMAAICQALGLDSEAHDIAEVLSEIASLKAAAPSAAPASGEADGWPYMRSKLALAVLGFHGRTFATLADAEQMLDSISEPDGPMPELRRIAAAAHAAPDASPSASELQRFLDVAAGEGLVLDGVDAADLYVALFPQAYAQAVAPVVDALAAARKPSEGGAA